MTFAIALSPGEPAGIGPDISVHIAQQAQAVPVIAYADPALLQTRAAQLQQPLQLLAIEEHTLPSTPAPAGALYIRPQRCNAAVKAGTLNTANADYVLQCLQSAANDCLQQPQQLALVTGPVQKSIINEAGIAFSGHTEFLQAQAHCDKVVMMLATPRLRVALVTTHLPLRAVPDAITADNLRRTLQIIHADLQRYFTRHAPQIFVCGLNPHAGENGYLGREEIDVIAPVLHELRTQGLQLTGPLPADTAFTNALREKADVFVAMYHDQGLPVLKAEGFGEAINITLGLPFVRTSVDHGTALDLAGTGRAQHSSLQHAIDSAVQMLQHGQR
ncbi:MAG TPA: 4-hydroxythreonine-4-phosphate dehydrogenase PdxA [Pseudomonadales bacterium]|jgi:4-hydroxythreonine-4-phosphate dehydrogenase|nr:4-hydroxythreonine-4-phosphate dehydrogenase PdxA [Pseudomonadales bacterium]HNI37382.1 4-hydroxythreonine-4-phosphate dehydrogenase PdxA [Pseudomonadales bacterium]HNL91428.1 4-hydroxythreonine-4-phosphate dehydrogenase PdxA [Pseudomonadales bacterium]HNN86066.1 4-hydroxythreonine-4-phosphate dehydrogenase PdxA [Pseudomonadales bacterium]